MKWYISVTAVHEYQRILGIPEDDDGPGFDEPAKELSEICDLATYKKTDDYGQKWHVIIEVRGKSVRLELTVSTKQRPEGTLDQLVRVRKR